MTTVEMPTERFRLSMLLYDTRYRSLTIQVFALLAFMLAAAWLVNNTVQNLAALGKTFDFGFLGTRAGYDINQHLISYTNDDTHARAALVGILNTFLVAILGCILATVMGVLVGVLRLSPNWLVSKLAGAYVDIFRNVPVLLWILAFMAVLTDMAPAPTAFRGENATAHMLFGSVAITNRGFYIPWPVFAPGWQLVAAIFALSRRRRHRLRPLRQGPAGGDRRDPPDLLDQARRSSSSRRSSPTSSPAAPDQLRLPRAPALQLRGRRLHRQVAHRALAGALLLHRLLHRRERPRRHPGGLPRPVRGGAAPSASGPTG